MPPAPFTEILLGGLAPDGGLVMPENYPRIGATDLAAWRKLGYRELALEILGKKDAEIEERVSDLLHLVNLADKAFLFPSQLSGGEAQRVSIARALATAPQLIFADEPTGNLDPETSRHIAHLLKKINELGTTILFSTHDVGILEIFKGYRRIELKDGRVVKLSLIHI